jgi:hypothetical protein
VHDHGSNIIHHFKLDAQRIYKANSNRVQWAMHGLKNTSNAPLTYYMVKWNNKGVPTAAKPADVN